MLPIRCREPGPRPLYWLQDGESSAHTSGAEEGAGRPRPSLRPLDAAPGAEAVALYELLRILPDLGNEAPEIEELAELLRSTPEGVEASLEALIEARFVVRRDGWLEVAEHPPSAETNERPREDELPTATSR